MKIYIRGGDHKVWRFYCILEKLMLNKAAKCKENDFTLRSRRFEFRDCLSQAIDGER
jgi:hypothetical protein